MPGVNGLNTSFAYPNYTGELITVTPTDTRFLSLIGGLTGGGGFTKSTVFGWQEQDLRAAGQNVALEGANAPTAQARTRFLAKNVVEIHHEAVETSYTRKAASQQVGDIGSNHPNIAGWGGVNPVMNEHAHQVQLTLKEIARDVNYSFLRGVYQEPSDNLTPRQTKGMRNVPVTNVKDAAVAAPVNFTGEDADDLIDAASHGLTDGDPIVFTALTGGSNLETNRIYYVVNSLLNTFQVAKYPGGAAEDFGSDITATSTYQLLEQLSQDMFLELAQRVWDEGGMMEGDTALVVVNSTLSQRLTDIFITGAQYQEESREIGGVRVRTILTPFGDFNVLMDRHAAHDEVLFVSAEQCEPVYLVDEEKGFLFEEELAKQGSADRTQVYGEIGLRFGNEKAHGVIRNVARNAHA